MDFIRHVIAELGGYGGAWLWLGLAQLVHIAAGIYVGVYAFNKNRLNTIVFAGVNAVVCVLLIALSLAVFWLWYSADPRSSRTSIPEPRQSGRLFAIAIVLSGGAFWCLVILPLKYRRRVNTIRTSGDAGV